MKAYQKFLLLIVSVLAVIAILIAITKPHLSNDTSPKRIPTYAEVVPEDFSSPITSNVIDVRDTNKLMQPRLPIVKLSNNIVSIACESGNQNCIMQSFSAWVRTHITYQEALLQRQHLLSPEETILFREGTSITQSMLLVSMLRSQNIQARLGHTPYVTFVEAQGIRIDPGCATCSLNQTRYNGPDANIVWVG